jgi:glycosyltransferase involved in cell wall biosynthesis
MPFFSIIIPTYNRARFIKKAIQSVLDQIFTDLELIIIDDASIDETEEIVRTFTDPRIIYVKNEQNIERCNSRNKGMGISQSEYICFLDSDDYHLPQHLEILYHEIQKRNCPEALFFTNAWDSADGAILNERACPTMDNNNIFDYIARYTFNPQRMCVHKNIVKKFLFDPQVYVCEDLDFAARIATAFPIIQIEERTTVYVFHETSFTCGDPQKSFKELENYNRIFHKPELQNCFSKLEIRRLLSMCYFHISLYYEKNNLILKMYKAIIKSLLLFPKGYNGKTNKILFVAFLYNLPILGFLIKNINHGYKN